MEDGQLELIIGREDEIKPEKDIQRLRDEIYRQFPLWVVAPTEDGEFYATIICDPNSYKAIASQISYNLTKSGGGFYIRQWRRRFYVPCKN